MKAKRVMVAFFGLTILVILWDLSVRLFSLPPYLVPSPHDVATEFVSTPTRFVLDASWTLAEAFIGFSLALVLGLFGGCILFRFSHVREVLLPWASALQAIPIVALAPLFVVWLGSGIASKILMSAVISFFPILTSVLVGFSEVHQDRALLFRVYRTGYVRTIRHLLFPSAFPTIVMGMKISGGLATVGAIVAEMTGADRGLGYLLLNATYRLETPRLFVAIILAGLIGWLAYSFPGVASILFPRYWESGRMEERS